MHAVRLLESWRLAAHNDAHVRCLVRWRKALRIPRGLFPSTAVPPFATALAAFVTVFAGLGATLPIMAVVACMRTTAWAPSAPTPTSAMFMLVLVPVLIWLASARRVCVGGGTL